MDALRAARREITLLRKQIKIHERYVAKLEKMLADKPVQIARSFVGILTPLLDAAATVPHRQAVAMFRLKKDRTAKEESKFMARMRQQFGVGVRRKGRVWRYQAARTARVTMLLTALGKQDNADPTPAQIEAAKLKIDAEKHSLDSPFHSPRKRHKS